MRFMVQYLNLRVICCPTNILSRFPEYIYENLDGLDRLLTSASGTK